MMNSDDCIDPRPREIDGVKLYVYEILWLHVNITVSASSEPLFWTPPNSCNN